MEIGGVVDDRCRSQTTPSTRTVMIWIRGRTSTCRVPCGIGVPGRGAGHEHHQVQGAQRAPGQCEPRLHVGNYNLQGE